MEELDDKVYAEIQEKCATGDQFAEEGNYQNALTEYWSAFDLVPEPKTNWNTSTWILTAIGDANFLSGDYQAGVSNLSNAMHCPEAIGNPFIHLRLGQCQFETGNLDRAADELTRAFAIEGENIFEQEDEKYLTFLKSKLKEEKPKKKWWKF
ncbi:MAG: tetratricopeptide repeat protein [Putridiphycobacter sp.]